MNNPRFYLIVAFASRCYFCTKCERFLNSVGRSACKKTLRNAAELQRLQDGAHDVSAQPADRERDPEADAPAPVPYRDPFDEEWVIDSFLDEQRRAKEDRLIAARAAASARMVERHRQARLVSLQQLQPG